MNDELFFVSIKRGTNEISSLVPVYHLAQPRHTRTHAHTHTHNYIFIKHTYSLAYIRNT